MKRCQQFRTWTADTSTSSCAQVRRLSAQGVSELLGIAEDGHVYQAGNLLNRFDKPTLMRGDNGKRVCMSQSDTARCAGVDMLLARKVIRVGAGGGSSAAVDSALFFSSCSK